jgi:hypothetical protein
MALLDDLPDDVQVAWFGQPWDNGCTPDLKVPAPDEDDLCAECTFKFGRGTTGAFVRDAGGNWKPYHRDCYWELLEEREAAERVAKGLGGNRW